MTSSDCVKKHLLMHDTSIGLLPVKFGGAHAPGMPGTFSLPPRVSDPDMRDARAVMHAGIANKRFPLKSVAGKTFPEFPVHAQPAIFRIW